MYITIYKYTRNIYARYAWNGIQLTGFKQYYFFFFKEFNFFEKDERWNFDLKETFSVYQ